MLIFLFLSPSAMTYSGFAGGAFDPPAVFQRSQVVRWILQIRMRGIVHLLFTTLFCLVWKNT